LPSYASHVTFYRAHLAQLRQDPAQLVARDIEVVVVGPEDAKAFAGYFAKESLPFIGLPDPTVQWR
jgi:peroxiredoxin Q/BCP